MKVIMSSKTLGTRENEDDWRRSEKTVFNISDKSKQEVDSSKMSVPMRVQEAN